MKIKNTLFALALLSVSCSLFAQTVVRASNATVEPVVSRDTDGFSICGIHTLVFVEGVQPLIEIYDFSIQFYAGQLAPSMKIGKQTGDRNNLGATLKAVRPAPTSAWIARELEGKSLPLKILFESGDSPGYVMGALESVKAFDLMVAMAIGERMHVVARYKSEKLDSVIAFRAALSPQDAKLFFACTDALIKRMEPKEGNESGK